MSLIFKLFFSLVFLNIYLNIHAQDISDNDDCPKNFQRFGDKCYKMEQTKKNWFQAELECRKLNAELVTIENEDEMNTINNYIKNAKLEHEWFWTSANDLSKEGEFHWQSNGKPMTYKRFTTGEPNNRRHNEHCVNLMHATENDRNQIEMNDNKCDVQIMYICESRPLNFDDNVNVALLEAAYEQFIKNHKLITSENLPHLEYTLN